MIKSLLKKSPIYPFWKEYREIRDYWQWLKKGRPMPPPHGLKQGIIKGYAREYNYPIFCETGTYNGDMIQALKDDFQKIYSVELSEPLFRRAKLRFRNDHHVILLQGNSGKVLLKILEQISKSCIFWLDAHYSGPGTAKGDKFSPIMNEIIPILNHFVKDHVILIDDARLFTGKDGYPCLEEFSRQVNQIRQDLAVLVEMDIIRIVKKNLQG